MTLDIQAPEFRQQALDLEALALLLGLGPDDFHSQWPLETADGDFVHLLVPVSKLAVMGRIDP